MFKNFINMFLRNLKYYKTHNIINIFSLAFALSVSIAIFSWVKQQTSFDKFHDKSDRIYRFIYKGTETARNILPAGYKNFIFKSIPEIESSIRIFDPNILGSPTKIETKSQIFTKDKVLYSDPEFFEIFSFQLISGDKNSVLTKPNSVVITEKTAQKYFGTKNPLGEILSINDKNIFEVTGVLKNIPENSHFRFDILATMDGSPFGKNYKTMGFGSAWVFYNYVKLSGDISIPELQEKVKKQAIAIKNKYQYVEYENFVFQPMLDIHLQSFDQFELGRNIDIKYIYLFSFIGGMILIIAAINYINLSLAYSGGQTKNIGIQKVLGAQKKQIIQQFIFNSLIISFISILLAWIFWELFAPVIATVSDNLIKNNIGLDLKLVVFLLSLTIFLGIITGFFPAFLLSKYKPAQMFRSNLLESTKSRKGTFRKILVTSQFVISTSLIIATIIIYQQMQYLSSKKLGYNKDQVVVLPIDFGEVKNKINVFKNNIKSHSSILGVSAVSQLPCEIKSAEGVVYDGESYSSYYITVDKDFFSTMKVEFLKGEDQVDLLDTKPVEDWATFKNKFVINEQLLHKMGFSIDEALNKQVIIKHGNMQPGPIIGIVKDFHFESLHNKIKPLIIEFDSRRFRFLLIHINSENILNTIDYIKTQWQTFSNGIPFEYSFLDKKYDQLYKTETQMGSILFMFSVIAILIASLGLLGLSLFSINKRTKEIGLRKVLGGSVQSILLLLGKELTKWVLIANIIAWPLTWLIMNSWLQNFSYKTSIELWMFVLAGIIAFLIAIFTVSIQSIRAAIANPVQSLRYE